LVFYTLPHNVGKIRYEGLLIKGTKTTAKDVGLFKLLGLQKKNESVV
jgi:hypothetical protein